MSERLACVLLVDERGRVLLQERDAGAPRAPEQWGMPGGHVEEGERFEDAAYRELSEETGLVLEPGHLYLWRDEELTWSGESEPFRYHVYVGRVDGVEDADIVVGEGRQIVFVDPATFPTLDAAESTAHFVPAFLASPDYARLSGFADGGADDPVPAGDVHRLPQRFASVVLVDRRGWVLLQERDEHPVIDPERWGFVGGHVEEGERFEEAAYRELAEETGVRLDGGLEQLGVFPVFHTHSGSTDEVSLWVAATDLGDADIVLGEGRQIVFVDPVRVSDLPLTAAAEVALQRFLDSATYARLCAKGTA